MHKFIQVNFEKIENATNIHISSKVNFDVECNTKYAVITHKNTSSSGTCIKIPTFFGRKSG